MSEPRAQAYRGSFASSGKDYILNEHKSSRALNASSKWRAPSAYSGRLRSTILVEFSMRTQVSLDAKATLELTFIKLMEVMARPVKGGSGKPGRRRARGSLECAS